jgi:glycosyltransferase involved in cell wall biosynthesis
LDEGPLVGYIGRIDTWKGVDVLLDALASLTQRRPGLQAVVAGGTVRGKEAYAASLAERASELGVRWLGPLPGAEAADLIADLDCLAYPSTGPEPWGLSVVESLACGVPVVTTDAGGPREILAGLAGSAGILVPPGDAAALASAIDRVLPAATSTQLRRARPVLRSGQAPPYPELFAAAAAAARRPRQKRPGGPRAGFSSQLGY